MILTEASVLQVTDYIRVTLTGNAPQHSEIYDNVSDLEINPIGHDRKSSSASLRPASVLKDFSMTA